MRRVGAPSVAFSDWRIGDGQAVQQNQFRRVGDVVQRANWAERAASGQIVTKRGRDRAS